ncbi:MAG: hypothetical protein EOP13_08370 [Pseudomonas sp.]|nr:MAG: hypothetical protein EOP13_08370 [Pseudomonas sp.]
MNANWIRARSSASKPNIGLPLSGGTGFRLGACSDCPHGVLSTRCGRCSRGFVLRSATGEMRQAASSTNTRQGIDPGQLTWKE